MTGHDKILFMVTPEQVDRVIANAESLLHQAPATTPGDPSPKPDLEVFGQFATQLVEDVGAPYRLRATPRSGYWHLTIGSTELLLQRQAIDEQGLPTHELTEKFISSVTFSHRNPDSTLGLPFLQIAINGHPDLPHWRSVALTNPQNTKTFEFPKV